MSYLTEEEAKTKICQQIVRGQQAYSQNGYTSIEHETCFASQCMAWRWAGGLPSTEKGYCGLAGRPGPDILSVDEKTGAATFIGPAT